MNANEHIAHQGIVTHCTDQIATIQVIQADNCHSCQMKDYCGVDDEERNRFVVNNQGYQIGQQVNMEISSSSGLKATFWAYVFPFILMVLVIVIGSKIHIQESILGLIALVLLIPYFIILSLFRKSLKSGFQLKITRL